MNKLILLIFLFIFGTFVLAVPIYAQEAALTIIPSPTTARSLEEVSYILPYPGLLPDHPLYSLKTLRDNIIDFFIGDPAKKAQFYLLQADKRLMAGVLLYEKDRNKTDAISAVISKSGNYFDKAIGQLKEAKKIGLEIIPMVERLILASDKHQEVLLKLEKQATGANKKTFSSARERMTMFKKELRVLQKK